MKASNITVIILTKNEEKRLPFILSTLAYRIPTIVFDGGSTDKTEQIALEYGAQFVNRPPSDSYGFTPSDLAFALSHVKTEYILFANCSYDYPDELISKFIEVDLVIKWFAQDLLTTGLAQKFNDQTLERTVKLVSFLANSC